MKAVQITNIAALTIALHAVGFAAPTSADPIAQRLQPCTTCHGKEGRATPDGYFPRIAGKPAGYLYNQLLNFREGRRHNTYMTYFVENLSDAYLREIARYFAELDVPYVASQRPAADAALLARGEALVTRGDPRRQIPACAACHGEKLTGIEPAIPGLAGLPRDYVVSQLGAWRTGLRHAAAPDCMKTIAERLLPDDVAAVSTWLSAQTPVAGGQPQHGTRAPPPLECGGLRP